MGQGTSRYVQDYLRSTKATNASRQMNFTGDSRYANMTGNMSRFTGGTSYFNATGAAAPAAMPMAAAPVSTPSHPYAITISNSNASAVANFILFNGNTTPPGSTGWSGGNYSTGGVTVSSAIGQSYQNLVGQSMTQPFTIGKTMVLAVTVNAQIQQAVTVNTTDASGLTQGVPIPFLKDPYQNQSDMLVNDTPFRIDGTTSITIASVLANAVVTYYFYPAQNINPASQLSGQDANRFYNEPNLIRVLPVAVR